jgi:hypothetical protein
MIVCFGVTRLAAAWRTSVRRTVPRTRACSGLRPSVKRRYRRRSPAPHCPGRRRGRARPVPRRAKRQDPPRGRGAWFADADPADSRPSRRQPTAGSAAGRHQRRPDQAGASAVPTGDGGRDGANSFPLTRQVMRDRQITFVSLERDDQIARRRARALATGDHRASMPRSTSSATWSNGVSTGSNSSATWPPLRQTRRLLPGRTHHRRHLRACLAMPPNERIERRTSRLGDNIPITAARLTSLLLDRLY